MNRLTTLTLMAGALLLLNSPQAAAHKVVHQVHYPPAHAWQDARRVEHMPYWLHRDKSFRRWYRGTPLRRDAWLSWAELFEIYHWERRFGYGEYRRYDDRGRGRHKHRHRRHHH